MHDRGWRAGTRWCLCVLLLTAWALHWRTFGVEELGQDGNLSVDLGLGSLRAMLIYTARDVHPPLFFVLLHALFALGGTTYLIAKLLPIAVTQLALVVLFRLVLTLAGTATAWCATILLLCSVPFLFLSPTVRPFTLGLCCSLLTLLLRLRYLTATSRPTRRQQVFLATAAALLSWYLQLFVLALEALLFRQARYWVAADVEEPSSRERGGLIALGAGMLLASPWYGFVLPGLLAKLCQGGTVEVALILARWQHPDAAGRYILGLLPFIVTQQALALTARPLHLRVLAGIGVALALGGQMVWFGGLLGIPPNEYEHDGESNFLLAHLQPGDGVLFSDHGRRGLFLLNRRFGASHPTAVVQTSGDRYLGDTAAQAAPQVATLLLQAPRVWYMNTEERSGRPRRRWRRVPSPSPKRGPGIVTSRSFSPASPTSTVSST